MKPSYEAIVIGTGFGGAVSACRLAQAGLQVGIFERGRRYHRESFPRGLKDAVGGWVWQVGRGLFDIRILSEMTAVAAAGYGGGSLVYANVQMRPPQEAFTSGWPAGYSLEALADYYDLVAYMLDVKPITAAPAPPPKTTLLKNAASERGRAQQFFHPNLAINFGSPGENRFGAHQDGCNFCGECIIGCQFGAKNTLDLNYLKLAEDHGADINTDCEVIKIEPSPDGYKVTVRDLEHDIEAASEARYVFVCAGSINSTELLLRCRDEHKSLPMLGSKLGHRYSGNGDFLALAFDTAPAFEPSNGPTITSAILYDRHYNDEPAWFMLQDGGYPRELAALVHLLHPKSFLLEESGRARLLEGARKALAEGKVANGGVHGGNFREPDGTAVFLLMGRDRADGVIRLDPAAHGIYVDWNVASNHPLYDIQSELSADFAKSLRGHLTLNPLWETLRVPVSVHNLGGCPMGEVEGDGVVDPYGEVYEYPGLYVLDGSILPGATGANPSHTIAAVAERNIEAAIRKIRTEPSWRAPQMEAALQHPVHEPLGDIVVPRGGTDLPSKPPEVLSFTETLTGFLSIGSEPPDYNAAERAGREAATSAAMSLTITTAPLDSFMIDKRHTADVRGTVRVAGITGPEGAAVRNGVFNLFVAEREGDCYRRRMLYYLPFRGADGKNYVLDGFKDIRDHGGFDVWAATTTLYTTVRAADGQVVACGILRISLPDFLKQLTTFTVAGTGSAWVKAGRQLAFFRLFLGTLYDVFVRPRMPGAL